MSQRVRVFVSTPSRHPATQKAYDPRAHRYRAEYVNPNFWVLDLFAFPVGFSESPDGKVEIPSDIVSFKWTVKQVGGTFSKTIVRERSSSMSRTEVQVPETGEYEITLQVNFTGGSEIFARSYRLRDFLVVSIGDSFASGQGNPDVPAIPSPDEKALCKATTLAILTTEAKKALGEILEKLETDVENVIEALPFVGIGVVAGLNQAEDVVGFIKNRVKDLGGAAIALLQRGAAWVGEGVEEVLGWAGIGDGGEKEETSPRPAQWQEPFAYRSYRSGHSLAARRIENEAQFFGANRVTFLSFARSGSEIRDGLLGPRTVADHAIDGWVGNHGQIKEAKDTVLDRTIDALIITIGVNDVDFVGALTDAVRGDFWLFGGDDRAEREKIARRVEKMLDEQMPGNFDLLKRAVDTQLKPRHVFITEYPVGLFTKLDANNRVIDGDPCGIFASSLDLDLVQEDGITLRRLGKRLNALIRAKADQFGWTFIAGIEQDFDGHGYCASQPYFVSAEESCLNQGDFEGMVHPNKKGHEVTRDCIARALMSDLLTPQMNWLEPVLSVMMR